MFPFIITTISGRGANDSANAFAYANDGKRCRRIGPEYWSDEWREQGMRQRVELESGEVGLVWEDELDRVCLTCNMVQWKCDCEVLNTGE